MKVLVKKNLRRVKKERSLLVSALLLTILLIIKDL